EYIPRGKVAWGNDFVFNNETYYHFIHQRGEKGCLLLSPPIRHDIAHIASRFHASLALALFYPTPKTMTPVVSLFSLI
ncbi:hypothetical protein, partial [Escherichia coli]|uniref:hypothetical protein n=1 Tax=Escherichia coli TaxID=562 RepID=UPI002282CEBA